MEVLQMEFDFYSCEDVTDTVAVSRKLEKAQRVAFHAKIKDLQLNECIEFKKARITKTERFYEVEKDYLLHEIFHTWEECLSFCIENNI